MYVYIIRCEDDSLYTGVAKDIERRLREHYHRLPNAAKYTHSHPMAGIEAVWTTEDWSTACKLEYRIKRLKRDEKLRLVLEPESISLLLKDTEKNSVITPLDKGERESLMERVTR